MSKSTARAEMPPKLEIQPTDALIDAPVSIRLTGLLASAHPETLSFWNHWINSDF